MEPISATAALAALGAGIQGVGSAIGGREQAKAMKRQAKETKRRTLAELLNAAMSREFEAGEGVRKRGSDMAQQRAQALQNIASQYVQALR